MPSDKQLDMLAYLLAMVGVMLAYHINYPEGVYGCLFAMLYFSCDAKCIEYKENQCLNRLVRDLRRP